MKNFLIVLFLFCAGGVFAQGREVITSKLTTPKIALNGYTIDGVSNDTSKGNKRSSKVWTEQAGKRYADSAGRLLIIRNNLTLTPGVDSDTLDAAITGGGAGDLSQTLLNGDTSFKDIKLKYYDGFTPYDGAVLSPGDGSGGSLIVSGGIPALGTKYGWLGIESGTGGQTLHPSAPAGSGSGIPESSPVYVRQVAGVNADNSGNVPTSELATALGITGGTGITTSQLKDSLDNRAENYWKVGGNYVPLVSTSIVSKDIGSYTAKMRFKTAYEFRMYDSASSGTDQRLINLETSNTTMGFASGQNLNNNAVSSINNTAFGSGTLVQLGNSSNSGNSAFGFYSSQGVQNGFNNTSVGTYSLSSNIASTSNNTALGAYSLSQLTNGAGSNIGIGYFSGRFTTSQTNELIINSLNRSNRAGDTSLSIIYGNQNTTVAGQRLKINARLVLPLGAANNYVLTSDAVGNASWQAAAGGSAAWGSITGTFSAQTDLQSALNAKQASLSGTGIVKSTAGTISYVSGTSAQYVMADGSILNEVAGEEATGLTGTTITLAHAPLNNSYKVWKNGVRLPASEIVSVSGATVTVTTSIVSTDKFIQDYKW